MQGELQGFPERQSLTLLFFNQHRSLQVSNIIFLFPVCACFIIQLSAISEQITDLPEAVLQCLSAPLATIATYKKAADSAAKTSAEIVQNTADDMERGLYLLFKYVDIAQICWTGIFLVKRINLKLPYFPFFLIISNKILFLYSGFQAT